MGFGIEAWDDYGNETVASYDPYNFMMHVDLSGVTVARDDGGSWTITRTVPELLDGGSYEWFTFSNSYNGKQLPDGAYVQAVSFSGTTATITLRSAYAGRQIEAVNLAIIGRRA